MTEWNELLEQSNRTLGLSVVHLEDPLRIAVERGVLVLFVVAAIESSCPCSPLDRRRTLLHFSSFARNPSLTTARALLAGLGGGSRISSRKCSRTASFVGQLPDLVEAVGVLPERDRRIIWSHAVRMAELSSAFAPRVRPDGRVALKSLEELYGYCRARAGMAGEMVTELLLNHEPAIASVAKELHSLAVDSALGIQLVDYLDEAGFEPLCPILVLEPLRGEVIVDVAREGIRSAQRYVEVLQGAGANRPVVAFASLPVVWAKCRLDRVCWTGALKGEGSEPRVFVS